MTKFIEMAGHFAAVAGVLVCLVAGLSRLFGSYFVAGFESLTLFVAGIALMVMACLVRLYVGGTTDDS